MRLVSQFGLRADAKSFTGSGLSFGNSFINLLVSCEILRDEFFDKDVNFLMLATSRILSEISIRS